MTTKVVNPTTKSNLAKEISPFFSTVSEEYRVTYCLFSKFTAYELLGIYSSWNSTVSADKEKSFEVAQMVACLLKSTMNIAAITKKWELYDTIPIEDSLQHFYSLGIEGVKLMDVFMVDSIKEHHRSDDCIKCAILTKQMFLNYYLLKVKNFVLEYNQ